MRASDPKSAPPPRIGWGASVYDVAPKTWGPGGRLIAVTQRVSRVAGTGQGRRVSSNPEAEVAAPVDNLWMFLHACDLAALWLLMTRQGAPLIALGFKPDRLNLLRCAVAVNELGWGK